jgi:polar amino acid transport system substrate-binding protein
LIGVALAIVAAAALAACGSSKKSTTTSVTPAPTTAANPAVEKLVPAAIKAKGTLTVASDASYPPDEFFAPDGHTVIGWDPDLSKALGAVMGLRTNVINVTFASILAGLQAGKYDFGASSFSDTKSREKAVDMVDYFNVGESFFTKASGGVTLTAVSQLCGHSVAVEAGTTEEADAMTQNGKCKSAGKPGVKVSSFPDQSGANLALASGRDQLGFADTQVVDYFVAKSNGEFKKVALRQVAPGIQKFGVAPYGFAVSKQSHLAPALLAALKVLIKNGTYAATLTKWHATVGATSTPAINGATS